MRLLTRMNPEVERKLKDAYFVGRLVSESEIAGTLLDEALKYKDEYNEDIQFYIKCLSPIPEEVSKHFSFQNKILTGNTRSRQNRKLFNELIDYDHLMFYERLEKVRELLEGKLLVFKLDPKPEFVYVDIVKVENIEPQSKYALIPGPQLKVEETKKDLEMKLVKKGYPITLNSYPNIFDSPKFIYYEGTLYQVSFNKSNNPTTYSQKDGVDVRFIEIEDEFAEIVHARIDNDLYFIENKELSNLQDKVYKEGISLIEQFSYSEPEEGIEQEIEDHFTDQNVKRTFNKEEYEFLQRFIEKAQNQYRLFYDEKDMISFHVSVKTNMLTIIGGMSGTGKTQLAKIYGETLGLELGKRMLIIPVSPSYKEPNDVLGFLNPSTGVYHESETGLVSLLLEAEKHPDRIHMVIFDEMNLSQVEHWFSPFISLLELNEEERYLTLFSDQDRCINGHYKSKIKIHNNIIFVGTVNFDETTTDFSDRLLDRANVIYPRKRSFIGIKNDYKKYQKVKEVEPLNVIHKAFLKNSSIDDDLLNLLSTDELTLLDQIHELLQTYDKQKGVSFRTVNGIARFIANVPVNEEGEAMISREEAFDFQIVQRILSKIKGIETFVGPLVGTYVDENQYEEGALVKILISETGQKVSKFTNSIKFIKQKAKELMLYGYVQ
ncbi:MULTISPECIES: hypothetical protein [Bacillus]|uniref:hypothetical protein n=1 Tax=Bacillus TaxID=1386 RepID=UPI00065E1CD8|nr:hypothetical protein [Bacillus smithii]AKP45604.1 5-methylcytosine-specific restriction related enzyme [Bacillus smithii]